ncbi:hypothetical protein Bca4012_071885 [Brassica carinata]
MKRRRWQHRRRRQHRYNQRHVLPSPPRVILCSLRWCFLRCLLHHSPPSSPPLSVLNHCSPTSCVFLPPFYGISATIFRSDLHPHVLL